MKTIKQQNDIDCGIACAAMLAGTTYNRAMKADPNPELDEGFTIKDMTKTLENLTNSKWSVSRRNENQPISSINLRKNTAILITQDEFYHWIVTDGQKIYDPDRERSCSLADYERSNWLVKREILASSPA
jgi:ABC-type bacteriocin/lantibiotic exporter with double-glycine peptidase domain